MKEKEVSDFVSRIVKNNNIEETFEALESQKTSIAWNKLVLPLYDNGLGDDFPDFLLGLLEWTSYC